MMRLAINGYGRIGRCVLRALYEGEYRRDLMVVAINEPSPLEAMAYLSRYDSTHGPFPGDIAAGDGHLLVDGDVIAVSHGNSLDELHWAEHAVDLVLECSGAYTHPHQLKRHLDAGAGRVLLSQPGEHELTAIVYGVNHDSITGDEVLLSNASCTSNGIVPVIKVLHEAYTVESGLITTIHSAMNDQPVIDAYHATDLRKMRAAGLSIIPVETGLAAGVGRLLPELEGRFAARALRVPTTNVSAMELSVALAERVSVEQLNQRLAAAAAGELAGVLGYTDEPLASCDFNHDRRSAVVDASQTRVSGSLATVLVWFDNEWAFANRMLDVARHWLQQAKKG